MVDRDREVQVMAGALADALDGQGRLLLVHGPAGIGKSRLLQEVRRTAAEKGALVLTARGSQLERDFGFGAVRQLFEGVLADPARRATLLAGSASSAAAVFDDVPGTTHAHDPADRADGSFAVLHGLYWLTVNLAADRPVVLAVDDVQWCDTGSVRALAFLLRRLEGLPVLIATTLRTGETHDDESLLAELAQDHATVSVHPGPLGPEGTAQLVRPAPRRQRARAVRRRVPPHDRRQPAAAAPAAARPAGRGRPAGRVARRHGQRHRLARRLEHGADAAAPAAGGLHRRRPRGRGPR